MKSKFDILVEDILKGGLADGKSLQDIADHHSVPLEDIQKQYNMGKKVEMEHTSDKDAAAEVAKDHLWENPKYYDKLKKIENDTVDEAAKCDGPTQKTSSDRKEKKWMKCVKSDSGGYKRIHWGQKGVRVTGKSGNTKRKKSFKARHDCKNAKANTPRGQACKDWE